VSDVLTTTHVSEIFGVAVDLMASTPIGPLFVFDRRTQG
jgi:hypothetical protein